MKQQQNARARISALTLLMLGAAVALLLFSGVQTARASLTYYSETYDTQVSMFDIGVTLVENGEDISWRNYTQKDDKWTESTGVLLANMLAEGEKVQLGRAYPEALTIRNSGTIEEYVRVNVRCYWEDAAGGKVTTLSPRLIGLNLLTGENGWVEKTDAATAERHTLYYTGVLAVGESTPAFTDTLTIDPAIATKVTEKTTVSADGKTITTTYDYNGMRFVIEAQADAVQTHNAVDAAKSAWGVDVAIAEDGTLSLGGESE